MDLAVSHVVALADRLLPFARPLPGMFMFDFGRYIIAVALIGSLVLLVPRRVAAFRRSRRTAPKPNQPWHEFRHSVVTTMVFALVTLGVYHGSRQGIFEGYTEVAKYGWLYWLASIPLVIVAHDAYFYWTHRWMHHPRLFRRTHRTHHQSVAPTVWAAYSFSIPEAIVQATFLPILLLFVPMHSGVLLLWMAHQILRNVAGHSGAELEPRQWLATWWGRWLTTTLHHDMHHQHGRGNYGLYFTWWDRWCGTEHPEYRARLAALIADLAKESRNSPAGEPLEERGA